MSLNERVAKRFGELEAQARAIQSKPGVYGPETVDSEAFQSWASSAMHLVSSVFGEDAPHYRNLQAAYRNFHGTASQFKQVRGIFSAAKSDFDGGYLMAGICSLFNRPSRARYSATSLPPRKLP